MSGRPTRKTSKGPSTPSRPEGLPKSPSSTARRSRRQQQLPPVVSVPTGDASGDDRSVGTQGSLTSEVSVSSTGMRRPLLQPYLLQSVLELIESEEWGGIDRFKKEPKHSHVLQKLLDSREDGGALFGNTGDPLRGRIGKYVDRWKTYSNEHYIAIVLDKYQVQSLKSEREALKQRPNAAKKKVPKLSKSEEYVSDLEDSDQEKEDSFVIKEIQTTDTRSGKVTAARTQTKSKPQQSQTKVKPQQSQPRSPKMAAHDDELSPGAQAMAKRLGMFLLHCHCFFYVLLIFSFSADRSRCHRGSGPLWHD